MKIKRETTDSKGRVVTVELEPGERLIAIRETGYYSLGQPHDDVVGGHVIANAVPVSWCSIEQKWTAS